MTAGTRGVVINTASVAAFEGQIGQVAYSASKGGVQAMTVPPHEISASMAFGEHYRPRHRRHPHARHGERRITRGPRANPCHFLSDWPPPREFGALAVSIVEQDYLNGETIRLDGALRMAPR